MSDTTEFIVSPLSRIKKLPEGAKFILGNREGSSIWCHQEIVDTDGLPYTLRSALTNELSKAQVFDTKRYRDVGLALLLMEIHKYDILPVTVND